MKKILLMLMVIILVAMGYILWKPTNNPDRDYLVIEEWGVKFEKPTGLQDLQYAQAYDASAPNIMSFITQRLINLDRSTGSKCPGYHIGLLSRVTDFESFKASGASVPANVKIGNYYYTFSTPQEACPNNKQFSDMETSQTAILNSGILKTLQPAS